MNMPGCGLVGLEIRQCMLQQSMLLARGCGDHVRVWARRCSSGMVAERDGARGRGQKNRGGVQPRLIIAGDVAADRARARAGVVVDQVVAERQRRLGDCAGLAGLPRRPRLDLGVGVCGQLLVIDSGDGGGGLVGQALVHELLGHGLAAPLEPEDGQDFAGRALGVELAQPHPCVGHVRPVL